MKGNRGLLKNSYQLNAMSELTSPKHSSILKQSQKSKLVFLLEDESFNKVANVSQSIKGSSTVIRAGVDE